MKPAFLRSNALVSAILTACLLHGAVSFAADPPSSFTITGGVRNPSTVTLPVLQAQPAITQAVTFASRSGSQTHTYIGASLWGMLDRADIAVDANVKNDVLNKYVVATGSDGYRVVVSLGEINPNFGARADLVAYAERIGTSTVPLGPDGFARTTAPSDARGGRYVSNLVDLDVRRATGKGASGGGPSIQFTVSGAVQADTAFDLATLRSLAPTTRTVGGVVYTGVDLWTLLTSVVGIPSNPAVKNDLLGKYVVATGSDGYSVVFSLGELDPSFGGEPDFVAYLADGAPLVGSGFARIVVPNDLRAGRWVSNLTSLEVFGIPEPAPLVSMVAGLLVIGGLRLQRRSAGDR